jgi:surfeit locus 1 family protein
VRLPVRPARKTRLIHPALFPLTAFALGTWQIQRLRWKTDLLARHEDALTRAPAILPDRIDADLSRAEEYRRVLVRGTFRHDQEMLLGPRVRDGVNGYFVITPMERPGADKILVNRGWIPKARGDQKTRPEGLPTGEAIVEGLLRAPWKKNYFTPDNRPDKGEFYFPDVEQMAALAGAKPVWIEETMRMDALFAKVWLTIVGLELMELMRRTEKGIPVGRHAEVNLSNNHAQYIATWYVFGISMQS